VVKENSNSYDAKVIQVLEGLEASAAALELFVVRISKLGIT
jgi:hypothetical protein